MQNCVLWKMYTKILKNLNDLCKLENKHISLSMRPSYILSIVNCKKRLYSI